MKPQTIAVTNRFGTAAATTRRNLYSRNTLRGGRGGGHLGGFSRYSCVLLNVGERLARDPFNKLTAAPDFAQKHRALNHRVAKLGELVLAYPRIKPSAGFFVHKEPSDLFLPDLEDETEIFANLVVILGYLVSDRS